VLLTGRPPSCLLPAAVAFSNPENYNHQAARYAASLENAVWTNQFDNVANRQAHIESTGPEIWAQTGGQLDAFTCATGTGGTLAGTTRYLKDVSGGKVKCFLADPPGSVLFKYLEEGKLERTGDGSITEGIGQGRVTENLKPDVALLDGAVHIPDAESIAMIYRILDEEGIYLGASSALNVVAAVKVAEKLGKGKTVVTILCDGAYRCAVNHLRLALPARTSPADSSGCPHCVAPQLPDAAVFEILARVKEALVGHPGASPEVRRARLEI